MRNVRTILLCGVRGFFEADPMPGKEAMYNRGREAFAVVTLEVLGNLCQRDVGCLGHQREDDLPQSFDTIGAFVAALWPGFDGPGSPPPLMPLDRPARRQSPGCWT